MSISITRRWVRPNTSIFFINDLPSTDIPILTQTNAITQEFITAEDISFTSITTKDGLTRTDVTTYNSIDILNTRLAQDPAPNSILLASETINNMVLLGLNCNFIVAGVERPFTVTYTFTNTNTTNLDETTINVLKSCLSTYHQNQTSLTTDSTSVAVTYTFNDSTDYSTSNSQLLTPRISSVLSRENLTLTLHVREVWAFV